MEFINRFGYLIFFTSSNINKRDVASVLMWATCNVKSQCVAVHVAHTDLEFPFFMSLFSFWLFSRFKNLQWSWPGKLCRLGGEDNY